MAPKLRISRVKPTLPQEKQENQYCLRPFEARPPTLKEQQIYEEEHQKLINFFYSFKLNQLRKIRKDLIQQIKLLDAKQFQHDLKTTQQRATVPEDGSKMF